LTVVVTHSLGLGRTWADPRGTVVLRTVSDSYFSCEYLILGAAMGGSCGYLRLEWLSLGEQVICFDLVRSPWVDNKVPLCGMLKPGDCVELCVFNLADEKVKVAAALLGEAHGIVDSLVEDGVSVGGP
jgi:hypothetical protein